MEKNHIHIDDAWKKIEVGLVKESKGVQLFALLNESHFLSSWLNSKFLSTAKTSDSEFMRPNFLYANEPPSAAGLPINNLRLIILLECDDNDASKFS